MRNDIFSQCDLLEFSSQLQIAYGKQITIVEKPRKHNGKWIASAYIWPSHLEEILLDTDQTQGENFIVLRSTRSDGGAYVHSAVSIECLEQRSQETEANVIRLLQ
jgi:hypothetical protein